ncbi:MAG: response regulator [Bryobacterales bacterium]|nr:response regulator [Bryobacteraceae bacterium]MDW8129846.1 response regulator [Bryobacterales bacterium]
MSADTCEMASILLVEDSESDAEWVFDCLEGAGRPYRIEHAPRLADAAARLAKGSPDLILLDLMLPDSAGWETFMELRRRAPRAALVVLSGLGDEALARSAVRQGAQDYLVKGRTPREILLRALDFALERQRGLARLQEAQRRRGTLIAFIGAKGGVGTTTVAVSVAAALARHRSVIIAELESLGCGLAGAFRLRARADAAWSAEIPDGDQVMRQLWKLPSGLRVLPGPAPDREVSPAQAEAIVDALLAAADRVLLDLAPRTSPANRAVLRRADRIVMVLEREPASVTAGCRLLEYLRASCRMEGLVQAVVVNRVALACPLPLEEIERQLQIPVLAVIPPNADLCVQARRSGAPVVFYQPESALSGCLVELAGKLEADLPAAG